MIKIQELTTMELSQFEELLKTEELLVAKYNEALSVADKDDFKSFYQKSVKFHTKNMKDIIQILKDYEK